MCKKIRNVAFILILIIVVPSFIFCNYRLSTWKEVEIKTDINEMGYVKGVRTPFDLNAILEGNNGYGGTCNTYVFSGEIINCQEFLSEWTDDTGEKWGPYPRSILEVKVKKEYNGACPIDGDTIKVLYPYSLSVVIDDNIKIKENNEYVFINCWVIDDKYMDCINKYKSEALNDPAIQNADVIVGGTWNSLFPINDGEVTLYYEYLNIDKSTQIISYSNNDIGDESLSDTEEYITIDLESFDEMITKVFEKNQNHQTNIPNNGDEE